MTYADYDAYKAALARGQWFTLLQFAAATSNALASGYRGAMIAPAIPSSAAVPGRLVDGAFGQPPGNWRLAKVRALGESTAAVMIVDRLSHQGGLDGTVATPQTTNLPTAALTRYVSGVGVQAGLEINTTIGSSGGTVTASYTNTVPTAGRTTEAVGFGVASRAANKVFVPLPLQAGDQGVTSVESVTLSGSTGAAGNFGVVLYMPLSPWIPINQACDNHVDFEYELFLRTGDCPLVLSDACLTMLMISNAVRPAVDVFLIPE